MNPADVLREAEHKLRGGDPLGAERTLAILWADTSKAPGEALHLLGLIRRAQNRAADAERYLRRAIAAQPEAAAHHVVLGELLASVGLHAPALVAYAEGLRLSPDNRAIGMAFARSALESGKAADAERALRRIIAVAPSADAWEVLSRALGAQDRLEDALAAIDAALELQPAPFALRIARANLLARIGRNEEALNALDALAAEGRGAPALAFSRGSTLFNLARPGEAEATFAAGVARWPANVGLQNALANARWMRGAGRAFTADFEAAVAASPGDVRLRIACADLMRRADFRERSEQLLREGLERAPEDLALMQSLGVLLDELGRTGEGLPLLQRAVARAPHWTQARANVAFALLRLGRGDEALLEIEPVRKAEPLNQEWICYETMALRQLSHPRYRELCDYERMVCAYDLAAPRGFASIEAFNQALAASLARLHVLEAHPLDQSLRGGSQTSRSLLYVDDPVIRAYLDALAEPIGAYIEAMGAPDPNHPWSGRKTGGFRLSGAWSVKLKAGGYHINHLHPAGWISSAYYVALPPIMAQAGGQEGWIKFGEPRWPAPACTAEMAVQPKVGRLVLFPSYMWHGTIPFGEGERLTAPFDVVPA